MGKSTRFAIERNQTLPHRGTTPDAQSKGLAESSSVGGETECGTGKGSDDGLTQSERFMKAARELKTDDDPERFKERVWKVAKAPSFKSALSNKTKSRDAADDD